MKFNMSWSNLIQSYSQSLGRKDEDRTQDGEKKEKRKENRAQNAPKIQALFSFVILSLLERLLYLLVYFLLINSFFILFKIYEFRIFINKNNINNNIK